MVTFPVFYSQTDFLHSFLRHQTSQLFPPWHSRILMEHQLQCRLPSPLETFSFSSFLWVGAESFPSLTSHIQWTWECFKHLDDQQWLPIYCSSLCFLLEKSTDLRQALPSPINYHVPLSTALALKAQQYYKLILQPKLVKSQQNTDISVFTLWQFIEQTQRKKNQGIVYKFYKFGFKINFHALLWSIENFSVAGLTKNYN